MTSTTAAQHLDGHPPICNMTSLVTACLTFYVESLQSDIYQSRMTVKAALHNA